MSSCIHHHARPLHRCELGPSPLLTMPLFLGSILIMHSIPSRAHKCIMASSTACECTITASFSKARVRASSKHDGVRRHWNSSQHDTQHSKEGESPCILLFFPVAPMKRMKSSFSLHFPSRSPFLPLGFPRLSPSSSTFSCCLSKLTKTERRPTSRIIRGVSTLGH